MGDSDDICDYCGSGATFTVDEFRKFFHGQPRKCSDCGRPVSDLWTAASYYIQGKDSSGGHPFRLFTPLNCKVGTFTIIVYPRQSTKVDFADYGIPMEAIITGVQYYALDGLLNPMERSGWIVRPETAANLLNADGTYRIPPASSKSTRRLFIPHEMEIFGAEISAGQAAPTRVQVGVYWLEPDEAEITADLMFWALEAFVTDRLGSAMMLAQVAREIKMKELLGKDGRLWLEDLRRFANEVGAPYLRRDIEGIIDQLRKQRNDFAHDRQRPSPKRSLVAHYLCATVFLVHYTNLLRNYNGKKDQTC